MTKTYVISDTHFGHENTITKFKRADGSPLRDFKDAEEMDQVMIARWNETVNNEDKVYHLGDVVIARKNMWKIGQLKGRKVLILGNHDIFKTEEYIQAGFERVHSCKVVQGAIMTHIPIHPGSIERYGVNIHGHLHYRQVIDEDRSWKLEDCVDERYVCVSVERTDYRPVLLQDILEGKFKNG